MLSGSYINLKKITEVAPEMWAHGSQTSQSLKLSFDII